MVFKRILKYTFAALMISIFLQSLAIIVIHYSDDMTKGNGTSKSFKNASIIKYKSHKEINSSPSDLINNIQENAISKIKKDRMIFLPKNREIKNVLCKNEKEESISRKLKIEEILKETRNIKKKRVVKIDDLLKNRIKGNVDIQTKTSEENSSNLVAMNIISSTSPLNFTGKSNNEANITEKSSKKEKNFKKYTTYRVKRGDALIKIAKKFDIKVSEIKRENNLKNSFIRIGQKLKINISGNSDNVTSKNEKIEIASLSSFMVNRDKPGRRVKRIRKNSKKKKKIHKKRKISLSKIIKKSRKSKKFLRWPIHGRISSKFGMRIHPIRKVWDMHTGLDIAAKKGRIIRAAYSGKVIKSGWMGGYGKIVIIKHKHGYQTRYAHCSKLLVKRGEYVKQGERIARIGTTGSSTGPHVHFEVRKNNKPVNPLNYLM